MKYQLAHSGTHVDLEFSPDALRRRYREENIKRAGTTSPKRTHALDNNDPWSTPTPREPFDREVDILVIGAGFAGLTLGAKLQQAGLEDFLIVDQAGDFGGTWYWNRYPRAQCDVEAYVYYPLLEETGYVPSSRFPMAHETFDYCQHMARFFGLYDRAVFHTGATRAVWDDAAQVWSVSTNRGDTIRARVVIRSNGGFGAPATPAIEGIETFPGKIFHSSRWDYGYTGGSPEDPTLSKLADKVVAVVGSGASAVQIIPAVAGQARHTYAIQRTPGPAIGDRDTTPTDPAWWSALPKGWQQARMQNFDANTSGLLQDEDIVNDHFTGYVKRLVTACDIVPDLAQVDPADRPEVFELQDMALMEDIRAAIDATVTDPITAEKLKPFYKHRCKRVTYDDGYFAAFNRADVTLIDAPVNGLEKIEGNRLHAGGEVFEADCIIFATGYDTTRDPFSRTGLDVIAADGETLSEHHGQGLRTLHGALTDNFPNMFQIGTSQIALSHSNTSGILTQAEHIVDIICETRRRGATSVVPTAEATAAWAAQVKEKGAPLRAAFAQCVPGYYSGYEHGDGAFTSQIYGESIVAFRQLLEQWRASGYEGLAFRR